MRKLASICLSLALVVSAIAIAPAAVSAASWGACGDSSTAHYVNGNVKYGTDAALIRTVKAIITIPDSGQFKPCSPDDNQGANGPSAIVELYRAYLYGAWVQAGIVRCENIYSYCTGTPRFFSEWHEGLTNFSTVRDLGPASYDTPYTIQIRLYGGDQTAVVSVNGVVKTTWNVGSQLNPGDDPDAYWFTETHDRGDGLGSNVSGNSTNYSGMQYETKDTGWWNRTSSCNHGGSSQTVCVKNGSYGLYFYTVN